MSLVWLLQRLAVSVIGLAFGTLVAAFFIRWSLRLTARMLGTPTPSFSTARTFGVAVCVALVSQLIGVAFELAGSGAMIAPGVTIANVRIPMLWFVTRPLEFFLLAGLMIRFLPTTAALSRSTTRSSQRSSSLSSWPQRCCSAEKDQQPLKRRRWKRCRWSFPDQKGDLPAQS